MIPPVYGQIHDMASCACLQWPTNDIGARRVPVHRAGHYSCFTSNHTNDTVSDCNLPRKRYLEKNSFTSWTGRGWSQMSLFTEAVFWSSNFHFELHNASWMGGFHDDCTLKMIRWPSIADCCWLRVASGTGRSFIVQSTYLIETNSPTKNKVINTENKISRLPRSSNNADINLLLVDIGSKCVLRPWLWTGISNLSKYW